MKSQLDNQSTECDNLRFFTHHYCRKIILSLNTGADLRIEGFEKWTIRVDTIQYGWSRAIFRNYVFDASIARVCFWIMTVFNLPEVYITPKETFSVSFARKANAFGCYAPRTDIGTRISKDQYAWCYSLDKSYFPKLLWLSEMSTGPNIKPVSLKERIDSKM